MLNAYIVDRQIQSKMWIEEVVIRKGKRRHLSCGVCFVLSEKAWKHIRIVCQ